MTHNPSISVPSRKIRMPSNTFGFMASGGSGINLSTPLAELIRKNFDVCLQMGERMERNVTVSNQLYNNCTWDLTFPTFTSLAYVRFTTNHGTVCG